MTVKNTFLPPAPDPDSLNKVSEARWNTSHSWMSDGDIRAHFSIQKIVQNSKNNFNFEEASKWE